MFRLTVYLEDEVRIKDTFTDFNNSAFDPVSSVIKLWDQNMNLVSTWNDPTKKETGVWYKDLTVTSAMTSGAGPGVWQVSWRAWASSSGSNVEKEHINVEGLLVDIES